MWRANLVKIGSPTWTDWGYPKSWATRNDKKGRKRKGHLNSDCKNCTRHSPDQLDEQPQEMTQPFAHLQWRRSRWCELGAQLFCFNWIYKSGMFHSKSKQPHDNLFEVFIYFYGWQEVFVFLWRGGPSKKSADLSWNQYVKDDFQEFDCRFPWQFFHVFSHSHGIFPPWTLHFFAVFQDNPWQM